MTKVAITAFLSVQYRPGDGRKRPKHVGGLPHVVRISLYLIIVQLPVYTVKPGYNDTCLSDTSSIASDILWYQLTPHC